MDPKDFLDLAQNLSRTNNEASLRTCISRSYYALFNLMAQFINKEVEKLSHSAEDHEKVYRYFNNCGLPNVAIIASDLNDLRDGRNDSDYKLNLRFDSNEATLMYFKARTAFNSFVSFAQNSSDCKNMVAGIKLYKTKINT